MDVIGFLYVSLGSSIVQLHDSLGSRSACVCSTGFISQNGDAFEEYTTEEQSSIVIFLWAKGLNAKDIRKEVFPVYDGKCLSPKEVDRWVEKFSQGRMKVADDETEVPKRLRQQTKDCYVAGFDALVNR
jgi:hypothetical protein